MGTEQPVNNSNQDTSFKTATMAKCFLLLLGISMMSSPFLGVEASPAPVAEPDPRDHVLVPVEDRYEDADPMFRSAADYEQDESAEFRSAEPRCVRGRRRNYWSRVFRRSY